MQIFAVVPWGGAGLSTTEIFSIFAGYFFRDRASVIVLQYAVRHWLFSDPKMHDLEWLFRIKFCFPAGLSGFQACDCQKQLREK